MLIKFLKSKVFPYVLSFFLIILLSSVSCYKNVKIKNLENELRFVGGDTEKLIDSLYKTQDLVVAKTLEIESGKKIAKKIEAENKELYSKLKALKSQKKVVTRVETVYVPQVKVDTIIIEKYDTVTKESQFVDFYPNKDDQYIQYSGLLREDTLFSNWEFRPIKTSLLVIEEPKGRFNYIMDVPEWLEIQNFNVITKPLSVDTRKLHFLAGASFSFDENFNDNNLFLEGGIILENRNLFSIGLSPTFNNFQLRYNRVW